MRGKVRDLRWLILFLGASFGTAALGGSITARAIPTWYRGLRKPAWNPPDQLFGPVWTLLYAQMAVAAWLVHRRGRDARAREATARRTLWLWWLQLGLNLGWSISFFGLRRPDWALIVIGLLEVTVLATAVTASRVSRVAGLLLAPYVLWTGFALLLNERIWELNRAPR
jgi:translocator protein